MSKEGAKDTGVHTGVHTRVQTGVHTRVQTGSHGRSHDGSHGRSHGFVDETLEKQTVSVDDYRFPITMLPENDVRSRMAPPSP